MYIVFMDSFSALAGCFDVYLIVQCASEDDEVVVRQQLEERELLGVSGHEKNTKLDLRVSRMIDLE